MIITSEQIDALIRMFGELGSTAYTIALTKVYADGIVNLVWSVGVFGLSIVAWTVAAYTGRYREKHDDDLSRDGVGVLWAVQVIAWVIMTVSIFVSLSALSNGVSRMIAPEWWAIQELVDLSKTLR